jgi:hypothetical protein
MVCYYILYNMIIDGKDLTLEAWLSSLSFKHNVNIDDVLGQKSNKKISINQAIENKDKSKL